MKCQYASVTDEFHGWECGITGGECALLFPDEKFCPALIDDAETTIDFVPVEEFWAEQVREYFRNQPFVLTADTSKTIGANLDELFDQARKRQRQNPGTQYLGIVLQHLVAAKLSLILPEGSFEIHGANVADGPTDRNGTSCLTTRSSTAHPCRVHC